MAETMKVAALHAGGVLASSMEALCMVIALPFVAVAELCSKLRKRARRALDEASHDR